MSSISVLKRKLTNIRNDDTIDHVNKKIKIEEIQNKMIINIQNDSTISDEDKNTKIKEILIRNIQQDKSLSNAEKSKKYSEIMISDYKKTIEQYEQEIPTTSSKTKSYYNRQERILGCEHYQKKCKLRTSCCKKWYICKYCHNEKEYHTMDIKKCNKIVCMECQTIQSVSNRCINPECCIKFANYYCKKCKYHNDDFKDIFHCDKCNMCLIGKKKEFKHCDTCNMCLHISIINNHKCIDNRNLSNCPICAEKIQDTSDTPMILETCQHIIHTQCFAEYIKSNYKCPVCIKTITDFGIYRSIFDRFDEELRFERNQIPHEYKKAIVHIYCNDCEQTTDTTYHFELHKCQNKQCYSFNTAVISIDRNDGIDDNEVIFITTDDIEDNIDLTVDL